MCESVSSVEMRSVNTIQFMVWLFNVNSTTNVHGARRAEWVGSSSLPCLQTWQPTDHASLEPSVD